MLKSLLTLTVLSAALALPVLAQDANIPAATPAGGMAPDHQEMSAERMQQMKAKGEAMYQQRQADKAQHRAKEDQLESDCHSKMQAATTPDQMKSIMQSCHQQHQAMRNEVKSDMQQKRAAWKAEHPKMGGQMGNAPAAPATNAQ